MKPYRNIVFYIVVTGGFLAIMYWLLQQGKALESNKVVETVHVSTNDNFVDQFKETIRSNLHHPLAILLLQIITIIFTARTFGFIFNKIGQPTVIGEIVAGIVLGPSLLGMWFPEYSLFLFPKDSLSNLQFFSQMGLVLFMFVIGMELDLTVLKKKANDAIVISHASIIVPYTLGIALSYYLYVEFAPAQINFLAFALFMGIAMSITAFPVLARIIQERGMTKTRLGTIAITCAAADDVTAWCILAAVIAIVKAGSLISSFFTILMALGFVLIMLKVVQPFLKKIGEVFSNKETLSLNIVGVIFGVLLISSYIAEIIGIHALFGAFLAGVIMPPSFSFRKILIEKVEYVALGLLLPLFFVFTGLRTQIGLLNSVHLWQTCGLIISVAILGKFGGSMLAARFVGQSWKDSLSIGALMNTRGLMELIVLNIGYDLGVLSPEVFAMMVLMALITTFMTGPALEVINRIFKDPVVNTGNQAKEKFKMLLAFGQPQNGKKMIKVANILSGKAKKETEITALHVTPSSDINKFEMAEYEKESFKPIKSEANKLGLDLSTIYKASSHVGEEIVNTANNGQFDILLVGTGKSVFQGSLLGRLIGLTATALNPEKLINTISGKEAMLGSSSMIDEKLQDFLVDSKIPVAVFIDKEFTAISKVSIIITGISDIFLLFYTKRILRNSDCRVSMIDYNDIVTSNAELKEEIGNIKNQSPSNTSFVPQVLFDFNNLKTSDLLIISSEGWKILSKKHDMVNQMPTSVLIIRP